MPINVYFQTKYTTQATEVGPARGNFGPNFGPIKWAIREQLKMYSAMTDSITVFLSGVMLFLVKLVVV